MNWNNIPKLKFKVYDPELKRFFVDEEIAPLIISGNNGFKTALKDRYYACYNDTGFILGFYLKNEDWDECVIFPHSGYRDNKGNELYMYDQVKHSDNEELKGVIDIEHGRWVVRYDSQRTAPLHDRNEYLIFTGNPDPN